MRGPPHGEEMISLRHGPQIGLLVQALVLACISLTVGLSLSGWIVGMAYGVVMAVGLSRGLARSGAQRIGPANWVTLTRATLVGAIAGLVVQSFTVQVSVPMLIGLSTIALGLDAADGQVARRTGSVSELGARFDMETDASLILVLSIYVSAEIGWWVLLIGAARYLFVAAAAIAPWMRRPLPYRLWRKCAAAILGVVLTVAASGVLVERANTLLVLAALAVTVESFGRDIIWLYRRRNQRLPEWTVDTSDLGFRSIEGQGS